MPGRTFLDFSTSLHWSGPPVGIVRVERELARWAQRNRPDITLVYFDFATRAYRRLDQAKASLFIDGDATLDTLGIPDPARKRTTDRWPAALRSGALWITRSRRKLMQTLERARLAGRSARLAALADDLQRRLMSGRLRSLMIRPDGTRRPAFPLDMLIGEPIALRPGDTLVCAGAGWVHSDIDEIRRQKARDGFRLALMCYDIVPVLLPDLYEPAAGAVFRAYIEKALPAADVVVFNSRRVQADAREHCARSGLALRETAVVPLGCDASRPSDSIMPLPGGLQPGHYVLFVSTIEARKGHRTLYEAWRRLTEAGVVASSGYRLVFVGRRGWKVDDLLADLARDTDVSRSILHLDKVDDATMAALYGGAAFCCYPSVYEGYGLPVVEAFHFGKAVLASKGGSLPEVVGDYSPCLDPADIDAWYQAIRCWIEDPTAREPYETKIRTSFVHPSWAQASADFFAVVDVPGTIRPGW
jgi:glycosyltransferase involved in cell wall biosynthesis